MGRAHNVVNRPTLSIDASGMINIIAVAQSLDFAECGIPAGIDWLFKLENRKHCAGYLVQHVEVGCNESQCPDCGVPRTCPPIVVPRKSFSFYEAWYVKEDAPVAQVNMFVPFGQAPNSYTDEFGTANPINTCGNICLWGTVKFYCDTVTLNLRKLWKPATYGLGLCASSSGELPSIEGEPQGKPPPWWNLKPEEGPASHYFCDHWRCCKGMKQFVWANGDPRLLFG